MLQHLLSKTKFLLATVLFLFLMVVWMPSPLMGQNDSSLIEKKEKF